MNCLLKYLTLVSGILFLCMGVFYGVWWFGFFSVNIHFSLSLGYLAAFGGWISLVLMYFNSPIFITAFTSSMRERTVSSN